VFTVRRPEPGVRHGKRCVAGPTHGSGGHARRCTRYVALGRFTRVDRAGANSFHFTGRLGGHALGAGLYRLDAVARELGLSSRTISARFRIR
jgi:AraC-like DNA-binding protein